MPSIHCHPSIRRSHHLQTLSRGHQERAMSHLASLSPQFLMGFSCKHVSYRSLMSKNFEQKTRWAHPVFCLPMGRLPLCHCPNPRLLNRGHKSRPLQPLTSNRWSAGWRENWKSSWAKLISSSKIGSVKIWPFTDMNWDLNEIFLWGLHAHGRTGAAQGRQRANLKMSRSMSCLPRLWWLLQFGNPDFQGLEKRWWYLLFFGPQAPKRIELKVGNLENLDLLNRWCLIFPMENRSSQGKIHPNFGNQSRPMDMLSPEASLPDKNASQPDKRLPSLDGFPALQVASQPYKWLPSQINGFPAW